MGQARSLTLRDEHRLKEFEKSSEGKRKKVAGEWTVVHRERLRDTNVHVINVDSLYEERLAGRNT